MSSNDSSARDTRDPDPNDSPERSVSSEALTISATPSEHPGPAQVAAPSLRFGRYMVLNRIGSGGVSVVYAAYDPELDRKIAIKLLHSHNPSARSRARLQREAQAMARLSHPNVVTVYDVGTFAKQVFITMEYVEGATLREWMEQPRSWSEVVTLFLRAGEGLRAAHDAGLVHRDFKPENVLVTAGNQPKVTDFGLVRTIGEDSEPGELSVDDLPSSSGARVIPLSTPITRDGAVVGTPAYMAPEQLLGKGADARADQFGFCVTLHEVLFGHRPYQGVSERELAAHMLEDQRIPRLGKREIPNWVTAVVDRGLSIDPDQRWPSMAALLAALADDPARRRRRRLALGAGAALIAMFVGGVVANERWQQASCERAGEAVTRSWNPQSKAEIERAMLASGASYAGDTWVRTNGAIDRWAHRWRDARVEACHDDTRQDQRVACLDEQLDVLAGVLDVLAESDRLTLGHALEAVAELPQPRLCSDPAWLAASAIPRVDPGRSSALRRELARARALELAGRHEDSLAAARGVLTTTEPSGRSPLRVEALLATGEAATSVGDYDEARVLLEQAHFDARAIGSEQLALHAALGLIDVLNAQAAFDLAELWARQAAASIEHLGSRDDDEIQLRMHLARLHNEAGDYERAEAELRQALEFTETALDPHHPIIADILHQLGTVVSLRGRYEEARELLARARAQRVENLGAEHPQVATTDMALAGLDFEQGEFEQALGRCEGALRLRERALGRNHPDTAEALNNIALVHFKLGHVERALGIQREVTSLREQIFGADHPKVGSALTNMSFMLHALGRFDEAQAVLERAVVVLERGYGPKHPSVAKALNNLAVLHEGQGHFDQAQTNFERALEIYTEALGAGHEKTAMATFNVGGSMLKLGQGRTALQTMQRGLELFEQVVGAEHPRTAELLMRLGVDEAALGQREQGLAHLQHALDIRTTKVGIDDPKRAELLRSIANIQLESGDAEQALVSARAAFEMVERELVGAADLRASIRFVLAQALWDTHEDRPRARGLVDRALAELRYAEDSELGRGLIVTLEDWRERRP